MSFDPAGSDSRPYRYDATPLTDEQILEHALRMLIRRGVVGDAINALTGFNHSVLDARAAKLLERLDLEEGGDAPRVPAS